MSAASLESFTCPSCGRTSYHPMDKAEGWCGYCADYTEAREHTVVAPAVDPLDYPEFARLFNDLTMTTPDYQGKPTMTYAERNLATIKLWDLGYRKMR